ncbi:ABC transporter permease [bacterium]|nr:ABC transporter permease [bacterium]
MRSVYVAWRLDSPLRHKDVQMVIYRQIYFTGAQALRLIALFATIIGVLTVSQSASQLQRFGGSDAIGPLLIAAIVRELGPLVTVLIVTARSVTAVASELASMNSNGEIDSLRACGVSPLSYLVVPRIIAGSVATLILAMHFVWISLLVGFVSSQLIVDIPLAKFILSVTSSLTMMDLFIFFIKTFFLGFVVFLAATFSGMRTTGASYEIPVATTRAVMWSFMTSLAFQIFISAAYYLYQMQMRGWSNFL